MKPKKNKDNCKIQSWATYRNGLDQLFSTRDSSKGWSKTTVGPTRLHNGFKTFTGNDIDFDKRKPKQILLEDFSHIIEISSEIVYFVAIPTGNYAGYYKYLDIYYKEK